MCQARRVSRADLTGATNALAIILRVLGVGGLFALAAVVMPLSCMATTHRRLGLGD